MRGSLIAQVIALGLVGTLVVAVVLLRPVRSVAAAPADVAPAQVAELRQQRIAALREGSDAAARMFAQGLMTAAEVSRWERELLEAELESAASADERVPILRKALDAAKAHEELATRNHRAGVAPSLAVLEARAYRLRVEIQLAQSAAQ